jgi:cob(I)alamin adenosyltransferase
MADQNNSIVTRTGDEGRTRLFSGEEVDKDHPRTCAYGDLDELVSLLGLAAAMVRNDSVQAQLRSLQRQLFVAGTELATSAAHQEKLADRIDASQVARLDNACAELEAAIPMPNGFILPGGTAAAAQIDHARTVARRLERRVVGLMREQEVSNQHLIVWLNRLSDLLWLLARKEEGDQVLLKDGAT